MSKRKPTAWMRPLVGPQVYAVLVGETGACRHLVDNDEASTMIEEALIEIRRSIGDERKPDALFHELFGHALWDAFGLKKSFQKKLGLTAKQWEEFEEDFALQYTAALLTVLRTNGWLRLPRLPAGARARHSRPTSEAAKKRRTSR